MERETVGSLLEALGFDRRADHDENVRTALRELHRRRKDEAYMHVRAPDAWSGVLARATNAEA
jgi:hypothetical protein